MVIARIAFLMLTAAGAVAAESPEARAAHFYAEGLERPLLELRKGALLIQSCNGRLRPACSPQQRKLAAGSQTVALLDALTLFPQRPAEDPVAGIHKSPELKQKIAVASAALLRETGVYDQKLFARYGATLRTCPDADDDAAIYRASLDDLIRIDLSGFLALDDEALERETKAIAQEESSIVGALARMPPEDCAAARAIGEHLMELMRGKLQPWSGPDPTIASPGPSFDFGTPKKPEKPEVPARELAHAVAGNFVSVVATELQLTAFPESAARIKAIADQVGYGDNAQ